MSRERCLHLSGRHSKLDLLRSEVTFINERLAIQYGIPNIRGAQFRQVSGPCSVLQMNDPLVSASAG